MKTTCLALITETALRTIDVSKVDKDKEKKGELIPYLEFAVNNDSAKFINELPGFDGYRKVYVYFLA